MYTRKRYKAADMMMWTRYETLFFLVFIIAIVGVYYAFDLSWLEVPWTPLALIGTAVAFVIGFQNNSAYGRIWEARMIWGGIVNTSRTFGMFVQDMVTNEHASVELSPEELHHEVSVLTRRHIAWMTALRHSMRQGKPWETVLKERSNKEWTKMIHPPEWATKVEDDLAPYLSKSDLAYVAQKANKQTALLYLQSHHLRRLKEAGVIWEFAFLQLESVLEELFSVQGKSERIKNFPYPRHFASLNHYFMWIFVLVLPFAIVPQFAVLGTGMLEAHPLVGGLFVWLAVPFYVMVAWVFHTMEKIGRTGENPFEGLPNDVPISTIARGIEIDLLQNLGEADAAIPAQFAVMYDAQM